MAEDINIADAIIGDGPERNLHHHGATRYTDDYKALVFQTWYNNGKPIVADLIEMIPVPETNYGRKPTAQTIGAWLRDFKDRAEELDLQVKDQVDDAMVAAKVEMLKRHAEIAREGQGIALDYLRDADLTPSAAVRLLVDMLSIEKGSMGIPEALAKVISMTNEDLQQELYQLIEESSIELEKLDE